MREMSREHWATFTSADRSGRRTYPDLAARSARPVPGRFPHPVPLHRERHFGLQRRHRRRPACRRSRPIPWRTVAAAGEVPYDLALSASENIDFEHIRSHTVVLPHGLCFNEYVPGSVGSGRRLAGLPPERVLRDGAATVVRQHPEQEAQVSRLPGERRTHRRGQRHRLRPDPREPEPSSRVPRRTGHRRSHARHTRIHLAPGLRARAPAIVAPAAALRTPRGRLADPAPVPVAGRPAHPGPAQARRSSRVPRG